MATRTPKKTALLSDEPTVELVRKARSGDESALEALLERSLPPLKRWAHGRLPVRARGHIDTVDLVQEAAMHAIARLHSFEPRHVGAMQAFMRTFRHQQDTRRGAASRQAPHPDRVAGRHSVR